MANPWDNDKIKTPINAPAQAASGSPLTLDDMRSLFQEIVSSQRQPAAPASENPDRQFYQSGVTGSDRQFEPEVYSVQSGDTLTRIAARSPFTLDQLKQANEGIDFDDIAIGQELKLPDMGAPVADTTRMPDSDESMVPAPAPVSQTTMGASLGEAIQEGRDIVVENIGIDDEMWDAYKTEVSKIESGGLKEPYKVAGGANDHYDGKYQLGKMAKADAAQLLKIDLGHTKADREVFRNDPALQEKAFAAFTAKNHSYLMAKSPEYRELDKAQQIAVLGFAHNQGWGMAKKWLQGAKEGTDAFGTKGSKYYNAITKNLGIPQLDPKAK